MDELIKRIVDKWFEQLDTHKTGNIGYEQIKPYIQKHLAEDLEIDGGDAMQFDTFLMMDKNSDDLISKEELMEHIKETLAENGKMVSQGFH